MDDNEDESIFSSEWWESSFRDADGNWHDFTGDVRGLLVSEEWFIDAEYQGDIDQALTDMLSDINREFDAHMTSLGFTPTTDELVPVETLVNPACLN